VETGIYYSVDMSREMYLDLEEVTEKCHIQKLTNTDSTQVEPDMLEDDISEKAQQAWQPKRFNTKQLTEDQ
jgi:hypothetical protein